MQQHVRHGPASLDGRQPGAAVDVLTLMLIALAVATIGTMWSRRDRSSASSDNDASSGMYFGGTDSTESDSPSCDDAPGSDAGDSGGGGDGGGGDGGGGGD